jgi:hypothetical protein
LLKIGKLNKNWKKNLTKIGKFNENWKIFGKFRKYGKLKENF